MKPLDRLRDIADAVTGSDDTDGSEDKTASPAAASGGTSGATRPSGEPGEISQGGSSMSDAQTSLGGADAVPGTPDATPSTRLDDGGEDHPHHEDHKSEDVAAQAPGDNISPAETDDV